MKSSLLSILGILFTGVISMHAGTVTGIHTLADGSQGHGSRQLIVDEGFDVEILGYALLTAEEDDQSYRFSRIIVDGDRFEIELVEGVSTTGKLFFQGPVRISVEASRTPESLAMATLKVTRSRPPADVVPNNSVVIPADETGPLEIVLESSSDLLNWVETDPGSVNPDGSNLFYRVRVKRN